MKVLLLSLLLGAALGILPARADPLSTDHQIAIALSYTGDLSELNAYLSRGWTAVCSAPFGSSANNGSRSVVILAPPAPKPSAPLVTRLVATVPILPYDQRLAAVKRLYEGLSYGPSPGTVAQSFTPISP